jgi:hypothetical protein
MLARLGSVLYWTGYLLAVLFVVAGCLFGASQPSAWPFAVAMIAMGVASWLLLRASWALNRQFRPSALRPLVTPYP